MIWIKRDELYHHGILGMKWGVTNGPPYPLGSGDHSVSEKKAGWRKSLDKSKNNNQEKNIHTQKKIDSVFKNNGFKSDGNGTYSKNVKLKSATGEIHDIKMGAYLNEKLANKYRVSLDALNDTLYDINNNFTRIDKSAREAAVKDAFRDGNCPWKYVKNDWDTLSGDALKQAKRDYYNNLGKSSWNEKIGLQKEPIYIHIDALKSGDSGSISYEDGGAYYGHLITVQYDFLSGKAKRVSVDG